MIHSMANNVSHKLSHTMIRGRTYYTNFRLNDSTSFVRLNLGTDSQKQAEVVMNQIRPYIPLVKNGTWILKSLSGRFKATEPPLSRTLIAIYYVPLKEMLPKWSASQSWANSAPATPRCSTVHPPPRIFGDCGRKNRESFKIRA
jgi:hypothetical protein